MKEGKANNLLRQDARQWKHDEPKTNKSEKREQGEISKRRHKEGHESSRKHGCKDFQKEVRPAIKHATAKAGRWKCRTPIFLPSKGKDDGSDKEERRHWPLLSILLRARGLGKKKKGLKTKLYCNSVRATIPATRGITTVILNFSTTST